MDMRSGGSAQKAITDESACPEVFVNTWAW